VQSLGATGELLEAGDATIDDAVQHADPMVLRGLLHQLSGDEAVAAIRPTPQVGIDAARLVDAAGIAFLRARAAAFLKAHRDADGAPDLGPSERLPRSLALTAGVDAVPAEDLELWLVGNGMVATTVGLPGGTAKNTRVAMTSFGAPAGWANPNNV
jgi:4-hydroxyacetophenone monooxygenase